jgi:hypothetical protein
MEISINVFRGYKTEKSTKFHNSIQIKFEVPDNAKRFQDHFNDMFEDFCLELPNWYSKVAVCVDGTVYNYDLGKVTQINGNVVIIKAHYYLIFKELFIQHFVTDRKITDPRALNLVGSKAPLSKSEAVGKLQTFAKGATNGMNDLKAYNNKQSEEIRQVFAGREATQLRVEKQETAKLLREQKAAQKKLEASK